MLSDPPHKPRFHALDKPGPAFADWSSFCAYTDRLARVNQRLEREDAQAREWRYRNALKNTAAQNHATEPASPRGAESPQPAVASEPLSQKIDGRLREITRAEHSRNLAEFRSRAAQQEEQKQREAAVSLATQAKTAQIEATHAAQVAAQRAARLAAARAGLQNSLEARKAQAEAEMRSLAECQAQAREMAEKEEERRREAVEHIRAAHWCKDQQAEDRAHQLYAALALQQKTREQRRIEKGCNEKTERERATTEAERARRERIRRETAQVLKTQIDENAATKQVSRLEEMIRDHQYLSCETQQDKARRDEWKREHETQLKDHQRVLQEQLQSNRQRRCRRSDMNQAEADINGTAPVRMDYVHPSRDLIAGLPGLGISHDRARHLEALDRNIDEQAQQLNTFIRASLSLGPNKRCLQAAATDPRLAHVLQRPEYAALDAPARLALFGKYPRESLNSAMREETPLEGLNAYELIRRRSKNSTVGFLINSFKGEEI